jgi:hypothetical protein
MDVGSGRAKVPAATTGQSLTTTGVSVLAKVPKIDRRFTLTKALDHLVLKARLRASLYEFKLSVG